MTSEPSPETEPLPPPGSRSMEGWLVSLIVHCAALLALALWALPSGSTIYDSLVLQLGPDSNASDAPFTLSTDPMTIESDDGEQMLVVEPELQWIRQAEVAHPLAPINLPSLTSLAPQPLDANIGGDSAKDGDAMFFGTSASGRDFVFVLDISGSMRARDNERFYRARDELVTSISKLRGDQRFYVYLFNWSTIPMFGPEDPGELIEANTDNITRLRSWLYTIEPDSGTDPRRAIRGAIALNPDAIFLLSDGKFNKPTSSNLLLGWDASSSTVFDIFSGSNAPQVQVNAIAFEDETAAVGMEKLAQVTEGQFRFVAAPGNERGPVDTKVSRDTLPQTSEGKLDLAKKILKIRRAEKLLARNLNEHAIALVADIDDTQLPPAVNERLRRIRNSSP